MDEMQNKASDLDIFLDFYKSTKAPHLRAFLKDLYAKSPSAFSTLAPDHVSKFTQSESKKTKVGRPKGSKNKPAPTATTGLAGF